ncbi:MAG: hypothetical protein H6581_11365 [Bacteroidia bacterium]|nr:hypothetical protein [Bacteroidia bacterium]
MGKRNVRILKNQLSERLAELPGKEVHLVMRDGSTSFGTVTQAGAGFVELRDANLHWYNKHKHLHQFPLEKIMEIIFDEVTPW